jgi:TusA-related sulfurtransferase
VLVCLQEYGRKRAFDYVYGRPPSTFFERSSGGTMDNIVIVDVRGEVCPDPLVKAMEAMEEAAEGQTLQLLTDFMPAVLTVTNAAVKNSWDVHIQRAGENEWTLTLTRSTTTPLAS